MELIADKVESLCGYKPDLDIVSNFLMHEVPQNIQNKEIAIKQSYSQKVTPQYNNSQLASIGFRINGQDYKEKSARGVMVNLFKELIKIYPNFLEHFTSRPHGKKRRYVARTKAELYPGRPDLEAYSDSLQSGWWIGLNYSKKNIEQIIMMACEVAGLKFGSDILVKLE